MSKLADECSEAIQKKVAESLPKSSDGVKSCVGESKPHGDANAILNATPVAGQPSAPSNSGSLAADPSDLRLEKELEAADAAAIPTNGSAPSLGTSASTTPAATPKGTGKRPRGGATVNKEGEKQATQLKLNSASKDA